MVYLAAAVAGAGLLSIATRAERAQPARAERAKPTVTDPIPIPVEDPKPGESWQARSDDSPFRKDEVFIVRIIAVQDGWVQFLQSNGWKLDYKIDSFKRLFFRKD